MRHVAVAVLAASCAAVVLCPADRAETTSAAAATEATELRATLQRSRLFETQRALRLALGTTGEADVAVESVQLRSPLFEPMPPQARDPVVDGGGAPVAMPLDFGEPSCDGDAEGPADVVVGVGGEEVAVPLDESPPGLLADLQAAECAVVAVREDADLRLGDTWARIGPRTAAGEIEVAQRREGATVTVTGLEGNVIFHLATAEPDAGPGPVLEVSDEQPTDRIAVTLTASRCDPHALIEYKRTFVYVALVDVGEDRPLRVDLTAEGDTKRLLEDLLAACIT
jgi:hypothetical protein